MKTLHIEVRDKIATYTQRDGAVVCGNSDYQIEFAFDSEWNEHPAKTARFIWNGQHFDQPFKGNICPMPAIKGAVSCLVGVYVEGLETTTSAQIPCLKSVLCEGSTRHNESDEIYADEALEAAERAEDAAERAEDAAEHAEEILESLEDSTYIESDPTVPDWAKQSTKPKYTAEEVGARPNTWTPTESDPTVPAWAKKPNPPTPAEIGAAPAGFGLGKKTSETQTNAPAVVDTWFDNGWYGYYNNGVTLIPNYNPSYYGSIRVDAGVYGCRQTFIPRLEAQYSLVRHSSNGEAWSDWEWVNPPMQLGVEYRTTERYKGKPLYVKAMDCGELPIGTAKFIEYGDSVCRALFCYGECGGLTIPSMNFGGSLEPTYPSKAIISLWCNKNTLCIACGGDRSGVSTTVIVKYWKTTD